MRLCFFAYLDTLFPTMSTPPDPDQQQQPPPHPPRPPSSHRHTASSTASSAPFPSLDAQTSRATADSTAQRRRRASSASLGGPPPTQQNARRRHESTTTPSDAPSHRADTSRGPARPAPAAAKKERPRPPNLAGPAPVRRISTIPDSLFVLSDSDRTPGSSAGSELARQLGSGGGGGGASDSTSIFPVDEGTGSVGSSAETGKGKKPLWAVGGVFPKHLSKRRRSSVAQEQKQQRRRQDSKRTARAGSSAANRPAIPRNGTYATQSSVSSAAVDDEPADMVAHDLDNEKPRERADPFDELRAATSRASRVAPLDVVVSNDSGRSEEERRRAQREGQSDRLEKVNSGGSRTIAGDTSGEEDRGQDGRGEKRGGGGDAEAGQMPGGELDQNEGDWQDDFDARQGPNDELPIRNWWGTVRYALREPMAEFLGPLRRALLPPSARELTSAVNRHDDLGMHRHWR